MPSGQWRFECRVSDCPRCPCSLRTGRSKRLSFSQDAIIDNAFKEFLPLIVRRDADPVEYNSERARLGGRVLAQVFFFVLVVISVEELFIFYSGESRQSSFADLRILEEKLQAIQIGCQKPFCEISLVAQKFSGGESRSLGEGNIQRAQVQQLAKTKLFTAKRIDG